MKIEDMTIKGFVYKAILQYYLPQKIRENLNDYLFQKYVSKEKEFFSKNFI